MSWYEVLQVKPNATSEELARAFKRRRRETHPDVTGSPESAVEFQQVADAYEVLSDTRKRQEYDQILGLLPHHYVDLSPERSHPTPRSRDEKKRMFFPTRREKTLHLALAATVIFGFFTTVGANPFVTLVGLVLLGSYGLSMTMIFKNIYVPVAPRIMKVMTTILTFIMCLTVLAMLFNSRSGNIFSNNSANNGLIMVVWVAITVVVVMGTKQAWRLAAMLRDGSHHYVEPVFRGRKMSEYELPVRMWGNPGDDLNDALHFGKENIEKGIAGEQKTAQALKRLLAIPGVRIMHGMKFPLGGRADVDHVVVCGNKIALIDSKMWKSGRYSKMLHEPVIVGSSTRKVEAFANATAAYRQMFPQHQVAAWVLIHSNDGGTLYLSNVDGDNMRIGDEEQVLAELSGWFVSDHNGFVDPSLLHHLVHTQMKQPVEYAM